MQAVGNTETLGSQTDDPTVGGSPTGILDPLSAEQSTYDPLSTESNGTMTEEQDGDGNAMRKIEKPLKGVLSPRRLSTFQEAIAAAMVADSDNLKPLPEQLREHMRLASADEAAFICEMAPEFWRKELLKLMGKRKRDALLDLYGDLNDQDGGEKTKQGLDNEQKHAEMARDTLDELRATPNSMDPDQSWREQESAARVIQEALNQQLRQDPQEPDSMTAEVRTNAMSGTAIVKISPNDTEQEEPIRLFKDDGSVKPGADLAQEGSLQSQFFDLRENGTNPYTGLSDRQQALIEGFAQQAQTLIEPWSSKRSSRSGNFDFREQIEVLDEHFRRFRNDWLRVFAEETQYDEMGIPVPLSSYLPAMAELKRQLDVGHFAQFVKEINFFNPWGLVEYEEILGINSGPMKHNYSLMITFGVEVSGDVGISVETSVAAYKVRYENEAGLSWEADFGGRTLGAGLGIGLSPVGVNALSSAGSTDVNAGSASTYQYVPPTLFSGFSGITYANGQAAVGGGYSISGMTFFDTNHSLQFNTTGLIVKAGTADVGEASVTVGGGYTMGVSRTNADKMQFPEIEEKEMAAATEAWVPLFGGVIYFDTNESTLTGDDTAVISQVIEEMSDRPDSVFRIELIGSSSQIGDPAYNRDLAIQRIQSTRAGLEASFSDMEPLFSEEVIEDNKLLPRVRNTPRSSNIDNRQLDRSCGIIVYYQQEL